MKRFTQTATLLCTLSVAVLLNAACSNIQESPNSTEGTTNQSQVETKLKDGNYTAKAQGKNGLIHVTAVVKDGKFTDISTEDSETQGIGDKAIEQMIQDILSKQSLDIDTTSGATYTYNGFIKAMAENAEKAGVDPKDLGYKEPAKTAEEISNDSLMPYDWDATPHLGLIKGDYYKLEERFRQGHLGTFETIVNDDKLAYVEFNETTRPNYYVRFYQNQNKRMSEYNQNMKERKGVAWIESVLLVEKTMLDEQRLTGDFDTVTGATNSVKQSMLPLAEKVKSSIVPSSEFKGPKGYILNKKLDDGLIGSLKIIVENGKITDLKYDEIFPRDPKDIEAENFKKHHGLSKYESVLYEEPSRIGFNIAMDQLTQKVIETQDLFNLEGLPAIEDSGDYKKSGFTKRNTSWDHYLELAKELSDEMKKDNVVK